MFVLAIPLLPSPLLSRARRDRCVLRGMRVTFPGLFWITSLSVAVHVGDVWV